jgi:hypothetical protein
VTNEIAVPGEVAIESTYEKVSTMGRTAVGAKSNTYNKDPAEAGMLEQAMPNAINAIVFMMGLLLGSGNSVGSPTA